MNEEERKKRLHELTGYLLTKYDLKHNSVSHICFNIKVKDVIYIVNEYKDIISSSNIYISTYNNIGNFSINSDKFKTYMSHTYLYVESEQHERKNHFKIYVNLEEVSEIEIDISCETILSFHFKHPNIELPEQFSFRNDK
jgi:hypothetical protein